jgi:hypothetical protein
MPAFFCHLLTLFSVAFHEYITHFLLLPRIKMARVSKRKQQLRRTAQKVTESRKPVIELESDSDHSGAVARLVTSGDNSSFA